MRLSTYCLACLATAVAAACGLDERGACASGYSVCSPAGATTTVTPQIGDNDFENLFVDIVHSSLPASKRSLSTRDGASLCCVSTLDCLTMNTLSIPFCYDRFTTNYFLPDGSFGTVVGGGYTSSTKDTANLETGVYTLTNGTTGNLYAVNEAAKPETAALQMPVPFTASGVGSTIPASKLGDQITITFTTTFSETTIPATTILESTVTTTETVIFSSVVTTVPGGGPSNEAVVSTAATAIPVSTVEATITIAPTTIAATTRQAFQSVVTTTFASADNPALFGTDTKTVIGSSPSAMPVTKKAGASSRGVPSVGLGMLIGIGLVGPALF